MILIDRITSNENIELAIDKLKKNKGSKTPGVDGICLKDILKDKAKIIMRVQKTLRSNNYKPLPVRRIEIPKENGKTRPLGIPTIFDRIIQQSIKQVIEPLIDKKFYPNSFGFRPKRSAEHAMALNCNLINRAGLHFVVDVDIKSFFDNINHKKLIKQLIKIGIKDKKIISIIKAMLKTEVVLPNGEIVKPEKGTPQGGILSPLLANVVLNELDWWIDSQWFGKRLDREYKKQKYKKCALKRCGLTEVRIIRYADDFKLLCRTREGADKIFKLVKIFLKERLKLEISKEKSKVINLKKKSSNFLGFRIKAIKRRNTWTARTFIGDKAKKNILLKIRAQIKILAKIPTTIEAMKFNSIIRGIQNYYKIATMVNIDLNKIGYIISKILYIRFGKGSNKKDIMYRMRFPNYNYKVWNIDNITLFTLEALIFKIPKHYSDKNYKSRVDELKESIEEKLYVDEYKSNPKWEILRAEVRFKSNSKCAVTGDYISGNNRYDVHHVIPKQNGGQDVIENLVLLKPEIHRLLHSNKAHEFYKENKMYQKLLKSLSEKK